VLPSDLTVAAPFARRNCIDVSSLSVVVLTIARWLLHADTAINTQLAAVGTLLLWLGVIQ
jgi:hypothetical protein